jgi:hypothetical protein
VFELDLIFIILQSSQIVGSETVNVHIFVQICTPVVVNRLPGNNTKPSYRYSI